jgi:hypothetical protein
VKTNERVMSLKQSLIAAQTGRALYGRPSLAAPSLAAHPRRRGFQFRGEPSAQRKGIIGFRSGEPFSAVQHIRAKSKEP